MDDASKTREQLIEELEGLRSEVATLSAGSFWADSNQGLGTQAWNKTVERFRELLTAIQAVFFEVDAPLYISWMLGGNSENCSSKW